MFEPIAESDPPVHPSPVVFTRRSSPFPLSFNPPKFESPMIVCLCHRISERDIEHVARLGCESFEELQEQTCVATGCGTCQECAQDTFERARESHAAA
ncbi:MAG: (2Fe-2S)-binding protein [Burkholderiaceae bacterium]|nr:(2Fe-2S)-binding protein [Burkholderiaceae bacterium]